MLQIRRLNMDTSWMISWGDTTFLLDPWLTGSEVDYFAWFNKQWHKHNPENFENLNTYDFVIISQPFSDHCHEKTIEKLDKVPIYSGNLTSKRLNKNAIKTSGLIPVFPNSINIKNLEFSLLFNPSITKASFYGLLIRKGSEQILYLPHIFHFTEEQKKGLNYFNTKLLITSFSEYKLPFFLGGTVNPGIKHAQNLNSIFNPQYITQTHDEQKTAKGIVSIFASTSYPDTDTIHSFLPDNYLKIDDYEFVEL